MKTASVAPALSRIGAFALVLMIAACSQEPAETTDVVAERMLGEGVSSGPGTTAGQWEYLGGDAAHTRYSPATEITPPHSLPPAV